MKTTQHETPASLDNTKPPSPVSSDAEQSRPDHAMGNAAPVRVRRAFGVALVLIALGLTAGFVPRWQARQALAQETRELAVPTVTVVSPSPNQLFVGVPLPAEVKPYVEASINSRASGYLKRWLADIGDNVKEGQLLAEIDTPELDQELARARAEAA